MLTLAMFFNVEPGVRSATPITADAPAATQSGVELAGLWHGRQFPEAPVRGQLRIETREGEWTARIGGQEVRGFRRGEEWVFDLPDGRGGFRGRMEPEGRCIHGHWIQPAGAVSHQPRATAVELNPSGDTVWVGAVEPLDESLSVYLRIRRGPDGALRAVVRNHENNRWGRSVYSVSVHGNEVHLDDGQRPTLRGVLDSRLGTLSLVLGGAPITFTSVKEAEATGFYPRGLNPGPYRYRQPEMLNDGWSTASLEAVALVEEPIRQLLQSILNADPEDPRTVPIHALLIARRGRLVLEEYFHGFHRARPHDLRSAGKTLAPLLVGVARDHGAKVEPSMPVAGFFPEYHPIEHWDGQKARLTVRDLMTMTSGLASDENDPGSPGHEDTVQEQRDQPDWYRYTLNLPLVREPGGGRAVYSSASLNLVGGVAGRAAGMWNAELFSRHVARPLGFGLYHLNLMPTGDVYTGGGAYLLPRDQLKLGQLYLGGGMWNGTRVLSPEWVEWSTTPHATFERPVTDGDLNHRYGYGWHIHQFTVGGRTFREFAAEGNGGQFIMVLPELEMVIVVNGGGYGSGHWYQWGLEVIPRYLIPAALKSRSS